jgi:hypothetical protein
VLLLGTSTSAPSASIVAVRVWPSGHRLTIRSDREIKANSFSSPTTAAGRGHRALT